MKTPESILQPSHPSYGCDQAWFVFGVVNSRGDITRVLIVEAKNTWAVQTLERVSNKDNKVNDYCELMTVGRKCSSLGTRSDRAVEVSYVDFILDIVEPNRLLEDYYVSTTFSRSLSDTEREYAAKKLEALESQSQPDEPNRSQSPYRDNSRSLLEMPDAPVVNSRSLLEMPDAPVAASSPVPVQPGSIAIKYRAMAALLDLGFKKAQVNKVLDEIEANGTVEDTIKSALQRLCAA